MSNYHTDYSKSIKNPTEFWQKEASKLDWKKPPSTILSKNSDGLYNWYPDGEINCCYLAIDHHIKSGRGEDIAFYYDSPVTSVKQSISFNALHSQVSKLAGGLQKMGVSKGDTVIIYMPMIPQAAYAMLACARIGAIHSVVFGGFAPNELAIRIDDAAPKAIITASCGIEIKKIISYKPLVQEAMNIAQHSVPNVIVWDRKIEGTEQLKIENEIDFKELIEQSNSVECTPMMSTDPLYVLYTSGSTGKPKGIVRDHGGHAVAMNFSMEKVYGAKKGEVFWAASDVGWVVGHSYIVYAPLIYGCTSILFEGKPIKTPDASTFWRVIEEYKVSIMFTAPTAIRAIRKEDPSGEGIKKHDLSHFRTQFLAGERCDVSTLSWTQEQLQVPVIDHWWQTESGWPMLANMMGYENHFEVKSGSSSMPVCGYDIQILNEDGNAVNANEEGYVAVKLPLPPGTLKDLWKDTKRFKSSYLSQFDGYYLSGDGGFKDQDGYFFITGRIDDVINVAGHRLSTSDMEEIVSAHPSVAECAVFGVKDDLKGQVPLALIVLGSDSDLEKIKKEIKQEVRAKIGAIASLKNILVVERLPKTRSGKILRKILRKIADNETYSTPSTIDDITILDEIKQVFNNI